MVEMMQEPKKGTLVGKTAHMEKGMSVLSQP